MGTFFFFWGELFLVLLVLVSVMIFVFCLVAFLFLTQTSLCFVMSTGAVMRGVWCVGSRHVGVRL